MSVTSRREFVQDNHYLPISYLRSWTDDTGRVWVYRTLVSRESVEEWRARSVRGVAYHQHLYTSAVSGPESDAVERWLAEHVDGPSRAVLSKIAAESALTSADWQVLLRFFAASQVRTPAFYLRRRAAWERELPALMTQALNRVKERLKRRAGAPKFPKNLFVGNVGLPFRARTRKLEDGQGGVIEAEVLAGRGLWLLEIEHGVAHTSEHLHRLHWTILRPPAGWSWLASDDPAVVARVSPDGQVTFNGGWGVRGSVLFLPLDPSHLLYARVGARPPLKYSCLAASEARFVQECTVHHAHRMVFSVSRDDWVAERRPRRVDPVAIDHEKREWARWRETQAAAERELEDDSTWPSPPPPAPGQLSTTSGDSP